MATAPVEMIANDGKKTGWVVALLFFLPGFGFSMWYLDAYYLGDTVAYERFYRSIFRVPLSYWEYFQSLHLGSSEPLYRLVVGPAAYYDLDRVLYISVWNGLLISLTAYSLYKYRSSFIFSVFLFTNYYLLVLLGPAERLKFAYICLLLAYSVNGTKLRFLFSAASIFFHTQALVQFASGAGYWVMSKLKIFLLTPLRTLVVGLLLVTVLGAIIYVFFEVVGQSISDKSVVYSEQSSGLAEAIQWTMLLIAGGLVFKGRVAYLVGMLPMGALTILFGNRVNVATLAFFVVMAMTQQKTRNPVVLAVMAYMSVKSVPFLLDVVQYGTAY